MTSVLSFCPPRIMAKQTAEAKYRALRKHTLLSALGAALLLAMDVVLYGAPFLGVFALLYTLFYLAPVTLFSLKNKPKLKFFGYKALIYAATFMLSFGFYQFDTASAEQRAEAVIAAVEAYRTVNNRYPPTLDAITPEFIAAIPSPRKLFPSTFYYVGLQNDEPHLMYVALPPFERRSWSFKEKRWKLID